MPHGVRLMSLCTGRILALDALLGWLAQKDWFSQRVWTEEFDVGQLYWV